MSKRIGTLTLAALAVATAGAATVQRMGLEMEPNGLARALQRSGLETGPAARTERSGAQRMGLEMEPNG